MKNTHGFTLLELMITVAIIGILAAIAIPNYQSYVLRGNRTVAKTVLAEMASRQESFFSDRKTYATTLVAMGYQGDPTYFDRQGNKTAAAGSGTIYSVALSGVTATRYTLTATVHPGSQQAKDTRCASLALAHNGSKTSTGGGTDCWTR